MINKSSGPFDVISCS